MLLYFLCVVFCSLTKDMTGKEDVYRGPAIRALCRITDVSVFQLLLSHCYFMNCRKYQCVLPLLIRSLFSLVQTTMLQAIERYMKQAIVDKVPSVSSSALVSSLVNTGLGFDHICFIEDCLEMFNITICHCYFCGKLSVFSTWWRWAMMWWSVGWMKLRRLLLVTTSWSR